MLCTNQSRSVMRSGPCSRSSIVCEIENVLSDTVYYLVFLLPFVILWILIVVIVRRVHGGQRYELDRRIARARVETKWIPWWLRLGSVAYLLAYALSKFFDRSDILDYAIPVILGSLLFAQLVIRPRRKREFEAHLRACNDRICPQCLYSLEDGRPDGTCPECGTPYTDEGLHAAWAFLHEAQVRKRASSD